MDIIGLHLIDLLKVLKVPTILHLVPDLVVEGSKKVVVWANVELVLLELIKGGAYHAEIPNDDFPKFEVELPVEVPRNQVELLREAIRSKAIRD